MKWAFRVKVSATQKAVLVALADHLNDETGECCPSNARLQVHTSLSQRSVRYALRALEQASLIRSTGQNGRSTHFQILVGNDPTPAIVAEPPRQIGSNTPANTTVTPARIAPKPLEPSTNLSSVLRTDAESVAKEPDARDRLWSVGLPALQAMTGMPGRPVRTMLGKLLKDAKDDCALVLAILSDAEEVRPIDPIPWLRAAIQSRADGREGVLEKLAREVNFTMFDLPSASDFDEEGNWIHGDQGQTSDGAFLAHDA